MVFMKIRLRSNLDIGLARCSCTCLGRSRNTHGVYEDLSISDSEVDEERLPRILLARC